MRTFDAVLPYLKKSYTRILGGLVMLILVDLVQLAVPKVMQYAIDHIQERTIDQQGLLWIALIIFAFAIAVMVLRFFWRVLIIGNSHSIEKSLRQDFYDHLLTLSQNFFNKSKTGDLMAYATNDLNAVRMLFRYGFNLGNGYCFNDHCFFCFYGFYKSQVDIVGSPSYAGDFINNSLFRKENA